MNFNLGPRKPLVLKIFAAIIALFISLSLLFQMNHYLHVPGRGTWNKVAKVIKKDWKQNDGLHFSPSWLSGFAMSRRRYLNVIRPDQLISESQFPDKNRVWIVEIWGEVDGPEVPSGFRQKSLHQFNRVWVLEVER